MSKLFELYIYFLLKNEFKTQIKYKASGKYSEVDFINVDEQLIIDTKYKTLYSDKRYKIEDIRQLIGYARNIGILKKINIHDENTVVQCVVISPDKDSNCNFIGRILTQNKIEQFTKFYYCGIKLPTK